jgi:hypothetical protein
MNNKAMMIKPLSNVALFVDETIGTKQQIQVEMDKVLFYDQFVSNVFVEHGFPYRNTMKSWAVRKRINFVHGVGNIRNSVENGVRKTVVYIGRNRQSIHYTRAKQLADELSCDLLILP